jgi:hypothetical protein
VSDSHTPSSSRTRLHVSLPRSLTPGQGARKHPPASPKPSRPAAPPRTKEGARDKPIRGNSSAVVALPPGPLFCPASRISSRIFRPGVLAPPPSPLLYHAFHSYHPVLHQTSARQSWHFGSLGPDTRLLRSAGLGRSLSHGGSGAIDHTTNVVASRRRYYYASPPLS